MQYPQQGGYHASSQQHGDTFAAVPYGPEQAVSTPNMRQDGNNQLTTEQWVAKNTQRETDLDKAEADAQFCGMRPPGLPNTPPATGTKRKSREDEGRHEKDQTADDTPHHNQAPEKKKQKNNKVDATKALWRPGEVFEQQSTDFMTATAYDKFVGKLGPLPEIAPSLQTRDILEAVKSVRTDGREVSAAAAGVSLIKSELAVTWFEMYLIRMIEKQR